MSEAKVLKDAHFRTLLVIFTGLSTILFSATTFFAERWFTNVNSSAAIVAGALNEVKIEIRELSTVIKFLSDRVASHELSVGELEKQMGVTQQRLNNLEKECVRAQTQRGEKNTF